MTDKSNFPKKLIEGLQQPGPVLTPAELVFLNDIRRAAANGVSYEFMQQLTEWEWQEMLLKKYTLSNDAWGPEYFENKIRELERRSEI